MPMRIVFVFVTTATTTMLLRQVATSYAWPGWYIEDRYNPSIRWAGTRILWGVYILVLVCSD
jgi:hypothetical protein